MSNSGCSASARNAVVSVASLQVQPVCGVLSTKDFLNIRDSASLATFYKQAAHLLLPGELSVRACNVSVLKEPANI